MKLKEKKLTIGEAAEKLTELAQGSLDRFPPDERKRRLQAFRSVIAVASSRKAAIDLIDSEVRRWGIAWEISPRF